MIFQQAAFFEIPGKSLKSFTLNEPSLVVVDPARGSFLVGDPAPRFWLRQRALGEERVLVPCSEATWESEEAPRKSQ